MARVHVYYSIVDRVAWTVPGALHYAEQGPCLMPQAAVSSSDLSLTKDTTQAIKRICIENLPISFITVLHESSQRPWDSGKQISFLACQQAGVWGRN